MVSFDLTANINARLNTGNLRGIANQLRQQLSVTASVDVRLANNTGRSIRTLSGRLRTLHRELNLVAQNSTTANRALAQLGNTFQNINSQLSGNVRAQRTLQNIGTDARNAGTQMEQFGRQAGLAFRRFAGFRIASNLVSSFIGSVSNAIKEAISFQSELVKIAQVSGRSLQSLSTLSNEVSRLSISLGVSSAELIGVSRILIQAGLSANQTRQALDALAKSTLAPTFTDIQNTAEGAIAIFKQFGIEANQLGDALGAINAVSGQFAVESDDIIAAVKRAGGVFASTSKGVSKGIDALNEFIAVFTSVRATTREGAETIATGLRTIFTRIQRPTTINFLRDLGVELTDLKGKFAGPFEAINRISGALSSLDTRDPQFARLIEELGGFRQVGKVIPLLAEQETRLQALQVAQAGFNSLNKDAEVAQQSLAVQLTKVREEFSALIREFTNSGTFKNTISAVLDLSRGFIRLADSLQPLLPLLGAFAAFSGARAITQFGRGLFSRGAIRFHNGGFVGRQRYAEGGDVSPSGMVPGGRGARDDVKATLQTGEFVIRRRAVDAIGRSNLNQINRTGRAEFAEGGLVNQTSIGAALLTPAGVKNSSNITVTQQQVPSLDRTSKSFLLKKEALSKSDSQVVTKEIKSGAIKGIRSGARSLAGTSLSASSAKNIFNTTNPEGILGSMFEGVLQAVNSNGIFDSSQNPNRPFDFTNGFNTTLGRRFGDLSGIRYIDAKFSERSASTASLTKKVQNQLNREDPQFSRNNKKSSSQSQKDSKAKKLNRLNKRNKRLGLPLQFASGGSVPALLTRGEFVVNKRAAKSLGGPILHSLNNADRSGFAKGGSVGGVAKRQRFAFGGDVLRRLATLVAGVGGRAASAVRGIGGNVSRVNRRGSGRVNSRLGALFGGRGGARFARRLPNVGPTATAGAFFAGSQVGGSAGAAIGGAATGAALGSIGGPLGIAAGAAIGGIVGGLNSLVQSRIDEKVRIAAAGVTSSLSDIEKAMRRLSDGGSIKDALKSLDGISTVAQDIANANIAQNEGIITGVFNSIADGIDGLKRSSGSAELGRTPRKEPVSTFGRLAASAAAIGGGAVTGGAIAGPIGAAVGAAVGGLAVSLPSIIAGPDASVSTEEVRRQNAERQANDRSIGSDIKSRLEPASRLAEKAFTEQVLAGNEVSDILKNLGTDATTSLGFGFAGVRGQEALGGAQDEKGRATIAKNIAREQGTILAKQIKRQAALKKSLESANIQLDKFKTNIDKVSDEITRAADAGAEFALRNAGLTGTGIVSSARVNPFANPGAFSDKEISLASSQVITNLGGTGSSFGNSFAGDLQGGINSLKDLRSNLGDVVAQTLNTTSSDSQEKQVAKAIQSNFSTVPASILNSLVESVKSSTTGTRQGQTLRSFAQNNATELVDKELKTLTEVFKKSVDVQNKAIIEYEKAVGQWIGLQQNANQAFDQTAGRDITNQNQITALDRNLTFDELTQGFTTQQNRQASRSGAGGSDLGSILTRLSDIDQERFRLENASALQRESGGDGNISAALADSQRELRLQQADAEQVLNKIATNTQITAAATQKLQEIENTKKTSRQLAEQFVTGSASDRRGFKTDVRRAGQLRSGTQFTGSSAESAIRGERLLTGLEGGDPRQAENRIAQSLANSPLINQLFQLGGRSAQDALVRSPEETRLRNVLDVNAQTQQNAGQAVGQRAQAKANEFLDNANLRFDSILDSMFEILKNFADTLTAIPSTVVIGGQVDMNININGGEALASLREDFGQLVDNKIRVALSEQIDATDRIENRGNA